MVWLLYRSRIGLSIVEEASMYSVTYCHIASNSKVLVLSNNKMMNSRIDSKSISTQGRILVLSIDVGRAYGERGNGSLKSAMLKAASLKDNFQQGDSYEQYQYFYHPDHLGSSSFITNTEGEVVQHIEYVPYGEVFIEERNNVWNTPYLFNAKEFDEETGLYYYGARYYDSRLAIFLTTDRYAEKYPWQSAYSYAGGNPVRFIEVNGDSIRISNTRSQEVYEEYKRLADSKQLKQLELLENSKNVYSITIDKNKEAGSTSLKSDSHFAIDVEDVGEYTVGILADELCGAFQIETGEIGFDNDGYVLNYDLLDEIETKLATIQILQRKGLKIQDTPTAHGSNSAAFGLLYDKYNGNIPNRELRRWANHRNENGVSYSDLFRLSGGYNSARRKSKYEP